PRGHGGRTPDGVPARRLVLLHRLRGPARNRFHDHTGPTRRPALCPGPCRTRRGRHGRRPLRRRPAGTPGHPQDAASIALTDPGPQERTPVERTRRPLGVHLGPRTRRARGHGRTHRRTHGKGRRPAQGRPGPMPTGGKHRGHRRRHHPEQPPVARPHRVRLRSGPAPTRHRGTHPHRRQPRTPCRQTWPPRPFQPFGRFRATQRRPHQGPTPRGRPAHLHQGPSRARPGGGSGHRGPEPVLPRPVRARRTGTDQDRHHVAPVHPHQWGTHHPRRPRPPTRRGAVPHPRRVRYTHRPCLRHHWRTRTLRPWLLHRGGGPHRHRGGRRMGGHHPLRRRGRPHPEAVRGRRGHARIRPRGRTRRDLGQATHPPARPGRGRSPVTLTSHAKNPHAIAAEDWTPWPEEFAHTYREAGYWTGETFPAFLRERATRFAEHTAVVDGHNRWTYAELDRRADSLATGLARLGVAEGDRVV